MLTRPLTVGALFAGYGGLELGLTQVLPDLHLSWYAELDDAPASVMAHHWPDVPNLGDVTGVDWSTVPPVDVITGGSPCQDLSHAGSRRGMRAGTRSGLWASMCDAIDIIRPRLVVWENVRGALSAEADSSLEPCPGCVGDPDDGSVLRALGRLLGDLAGVGYDAQWVSLRAADVGAPHGRFRVFLTATPTDAGSGGGYKAFQHDGRRPAGVNGSSVPDEPDRDALRAGPVRALIPTPSASDWKGSTVTRRQAGMHRGQLDAFVEGVTLLPTPTSSDTNGPGAHGAGGPDLRTAVGSLLPTPSVADGTGGHATRGGARSDELLLPGVAKKLAENAGPVQLLPTPRATDGTKDGPNQRGSSGDLMLPSAVQALLPTPTAADSKASGGSSPSDVTLTDAVVRTDMGRQENPRHLLPTPMVGSTSPAAHGQISGQWRDAMADALTRWGDYAPAIARWEAVLGRPAPAPTEPGAKGGHRLSPRFVEWLMGLPDGWVCDVPGITRNQALKALGNGVVAQQAAAALTHLLTESTC